MKSLNTSKDKTVKKWLWVIASTLLLSMWNCRQNNAYVTCVSEIQNDTILIAMHQMMGIPFTVITPPLLNAALARNTQYLYELDLFEENKLNPAQLEERDGIRQKIEENNRNWRRWQTDPSLYNLTGEVQRLLDQPQLTLEERLLAVSQCLGQAKHYYLAAKTNLVPARSSPERSQLAAQKQILGLRLLSERLPDSIRQASLTLEIDQELMTNSQEAHLQLKDYIAFCESMWFEHMDSVIQQ